MPFFYYAYGLSIQSDLPLTELKPGPAMPAQVTVQAATFGRPWLAGEKISFEFAAGRANFAFGRVGRFEACENGLIRYELVPGGNPSLAGVVLLGPVFAALLQMRGQLVLHASAMAVRGRGVVFLGAKGAGKSTLAAALLGAGHRFITDDVLAISAGGNLIPGFPQIKLATPLNGLPGAVPIPEIGKSRIDAGAMAEPAPPAVIYVLRGGSKLSCEPLNGAEAIGALMGHSYMARFGQTFFAPTSALASAHLQQCAAVLGAAPVRLLTVPRSLDRLAETVEFIERDTGIV